MRTLIALSALLLFAACENTNQSQETSLTQIQESPETVHEDTIPVKPSFQDNYYNDVAQFLAGLKGDSINSKFKEFHELENWADYSSQVNKSWTRFEDRKLSTIKPWVVQNIIETGRCGENAFYPFSGPDFTYLNAFLPDAKNYYLFGLEPVGVIPDVNLLEKDSIDQLYAAMNQAIFDNLHLSFFITKKMKEEINNDQVSGTIPVLLFFMARSGKLIENVEALDIDDEGKLIVMECRDSIQKPFKKIVRIDFRDQAEAPTKSLHYFSMNIANSGFSSSSPLGKFFNALPNDMTTLVKSASYCMHEEKFSDIRDVVLAKSKYLIEDDSGIPFRFFNPEQWNTHCYGSYDEPIDAFIEYQQEDLKSAFKEALGLPFRFGYDYPSNLLITERKDSL
ncbi:MAG: hypothetical protein ACO2Z9_03560 [Crocinitomicaceae bacterium]